MLDHNEVDLLVNKIQKNNKVAPKDVADVLDCLQHYAELSTIVDYWKFGYAKNPTKNNKATGFDHILMSFENKENKDMEEGWKKNTNTALKKVVIAKCDEREKAGFDHLNDSDIMDILEECQRKGIKYTRQDLEELGLR
jgi:hypothetical protein